MNTFENIDRARNLLQYVSPREAMESLVASGLSVEDAFLVIKAATVVPSPPPGECHYCGNNPTRHKMSCTYVK